MRVAVTGHTGFIGQALVRRLRSGGHTVLGISRRAPAAGTDDLQWDPSAGKLDPAGLDGVEAVIHLAGESVAEGRWTAARKAAIRNSRTESTALLARTLAGLQAPPAVLLSSSAVGYYGDTGDTAVTEAAGAGGDFLAGVCREWEAAAAPAEEAGIRVCRMRVGVVLHREGGVLARVLPPFRAGLGGRLGRGDHWMSWIARDDILRAIEFLLQRSDLSGPFNLVGPAPATNAEFTRTLARVLHRPAWLPVPPAALRLLFGEMADAVILQSARVLPANLERAGFTWRHATLESALRVALAG